MTFWSWVGVAAKVMQNGQLLREAAAGKLHEVRAAKFEEGTRWSESLANVDISDVEALSQYFEPRLFRQLQFVGCTFSHVNLDGLRCKRTHFRGCTFVSVVFGETRVGNLRRARFEGCRFEGVRLSHLFVGDSRFADCTFDGVISISTQWERCSFERTVMRGSLEKVAFLNARFVDVDFTGASMQSCHIVGPADGVALPDHAGLFVLAPDRLKQIAAGVAGELTATGRERFSRAAEVYSRIKGPLIIDESIWSDLPRADRVLVMSRLFVLRKSRTEGTHADG